MKKITIDQGYFILTLAVTRDFYTDAICGRIKLRIRSGCSFIEDTRKQYIIQCEKDTFCSDLNTHLPWVETSFHCFVEKTEVSNNKKHLYKCIELMFKKLRKQMIKEYKHMNSKHLFKKFAYKAKICIKDIVSSFLMLFARFYYRFVPWN
jgi:hypothetical protein